VIDTGGCDFAIDVALDSTGDAFVAGSPGTMKFLGSSGSLLWRREIPHPPECLKGGCLVAKSMAVDAHGDAVVAGFLAGQGNFVVAKLRGSDGATSWSRFFDFAECDDEVYGVAVDASGDVALGGSVLRPLDGVCFWPNGAQYAVLKLTGPSGKDFWKPCQDDLDNDGDGKADYPADPGCKDVTWSTENPACQNGLDDDGEAGLDYDGGASINAGVPLDSADPDCIGRPWRKAESPSAGACGLGVELALPILLLGRWWRRRARAVHWPPVS
jgi:hypothetical protein